MGWDGYAYRQDGSLVTRDTMTRSEKIFFTKASKFVVEESDTVDFMLKDGSLDCSACGEEIAAIIGVPITNMELISADLIKEKIKDLKLDCDSYYWARLSAIMFLRGCAKFGFNFQNQW